MRTDHVAVGAVVLALTLLVPLASSAQGPQEIFVLPTYQTDGGGLGVGVGTFGLWPATAQSAVRMIVEVPSDLQTFQSANVVFIPGPGGASALNVWVCSGQIGDLVTAPCAGPTVHAFTPVPDQITEVDISGIVGPLAGVPGTRYISVVAYAWPVTSIDHILGMRFTYNPVPPSGVATLGTNTFTGAQTAPAFIGDGAGLTNLAVPSGVATLGANAFTGTQTAPAFIGDVTGNVSGSAASFTGVLAGDVTGPQNATVLGTNLTLGGTTTGIFSGPLTGDVTGNVTGDVIGNVTGDVTGNVSGSAASFTGVLAGDVTGPQNATVLGTNLTLGGTTTGIFSGPLTGDVTGNVTGNLTGNVTGDVTGNASGSAASFTGLLAGDVTGPQNATVLGTNLTLGGTTTGIFSGPLTGDVTGNVTGDVIGNVTGDVTGNASGSAASFTGLLAGDVTGPQNATVLGTNLTLGGTTTGIFSGPLTGDVTGNITGDVTGNVSGSAASFTGLLGGDVTGPQAATVVSPLIARDTEIVPTVLAADGTGSTLDADLLDGLNSSAFVQAGANTFTGTQTIDTGNLDLDASTAATGNLLKDGTRFLHNFGTSNTFVGEGAGNFAMTGSQNTASGGFALSGNTTGDFNTATGRQALLFNTTGERNTAAGISALLNNTTGSSNTASGGTALFNNTTGINNTASGYAALFFSTTGSQNTASGTSALNNTTGNFNTAVGFSAGLNATTGNNNIYLGANVLGVAGDSNTMYLGGVGQTRAFIGGVRGTTTDVADAIPVVIDSAGQLGTGAIGAASVSFNYADSASQGGPAADALLFGGVAPSEYATTGANTFTGTQNVVGDLVVSGNLAAKYQDVAEWVDAREDLAAGTVVVIDGDAFNRVQAASGAYDTGVAGAVSRQPGLILGESGAGRVLVAQSGRVRIKVDATYGAIRPGDILVTSPTPGRAMRSTPMEVGDAAFHRPGTVLGKALESLEGGLGEILVLFTLQ